MAMVLYVPDKPDNPKLPILGKEFEYFPKLVVQMWCNLSDIRWDLLPAGAHPDQSQKYVSKHRSLQV